MLWPTAAHAFGHCTDANYMASFNANIGAQPQDCDVLDTLRVRWSGHDVPMRLVKLQASHQELASKERTGIHELADKVGVALAQMGAVSIDPITVMYRDVPSPYVGTPAHTWGRPGECTITFWKTDNRSTQDRFLAVLAHELFHCVQRATWPGNPENRGWWWSEGMATYFAYLAIPGTTVGDEVIPRFDQKIGVTSIVDLDPLGGYPAVVFFLWLGQTQNPAAITHFMMAMPDVNARDMQLAALRREVPIDAWLAFAEAYLDQTIVMPGGRQLPSSPSFGTPLAVSDGTTLAMQAIPYAVQTRKLDFRAHSMFTPQLANRPSDARVMWRKLEHGAWSAPPGSLPTCPDADSERAVWVTSTSSSAGDMRFGEDHRNDVCSCPAGTWAETNESLHHYFEQAALGPPPRLLNGGRRLVLSSDHTGTFSYVKIELETVPNAEGQFTNWTLDGTSHFTWRITGDMVLTVLQRGAAQLLAKHATFHSARGVAVNDMSILGQTIGHHFRCEGDRLILTNPPAVLVGGRRPPSADMTFVRASGP